MNNFGDFVDKVKGVIEEVDDLKEKFNAVSTLKDILFDELDDRFGSFEQTIMSFKDGVLGVVDDKFDALKEHIKLDQESLKKELFKALEVLKDEVKGMSFDFGDISEKSSVSKEELISILEALKRESPDVFKQRSQVIDYMGAKLKGKEVEENWYTLYKVVRNRPI